MERVAAVLEEVNDHLSDIGFFRNLVVQKIDVLKRQQGEFPLVLTMIFRAPIICYRAWFGGVGI